MTTDRVQRALAATGERPRRHTVGPSTALLAAIALASALAPAGVPAPFDTWNVGVAGQSLPTVSIGDATVVEGSSGFTTLSFPVTLSAASAQEVRVGYGTVLGVDGGTATGGLTQVVRQSAAVLTTIPDSGPASNYPITINVSGVAGVLEQLGVALNGLTHTNPSDIDVLLEAPSGETMVILSDAGGSTAAAKAVVTLKDDASAAVPSPLVSGAFWPYSGPPADNFPAPAPAGPYTEAGPAGPGTLNDLYRGITPNGTWKIWIADDTPGNQGSIGNIALTFGVADPTADFVPRLGQLVFPPGKTSKTIDVKVNADLSVEANETIIQDLFAPIGSQLGRTRATGTIVNDDGGGGGPPPIAYDDSYAARSEASGITVAAPGLLVNDISAGGGPPTAELVTPPANGTVSLGTDGGFRYDKKAGFVGTDTFTYRVRDNNGTSNIATVRIVIFEGAFPSNLEAVANTQDVFGVRVTLRFEAPPGPAPDGYALSGGTRPGEVLAVVPTNSQYPIVELPDFPKGSYYLRVHGVVNGQLTGTSNEIVVHNTTAVAPSAPENLLIAVNGSRLDLAWKNSYRGGITTNVILDVIGDATVSLPLGSVETFSFAGVPASLNLNFSVRAVNAGGSSANSNQVSGSFPGTCTPPLTPENFLLYVNGTVLGAIWDLPASGTAPTGYTLDVDSAVYRGTVKVPRLTNLRANVTSGSYSLRVKADHDECGSSGYTPWQTVQR